MFRRRIERYFLTMLAALLANGAGWLWLGGGADGWSAAALGAALVAMLGRAWERWEMRLPRPAATALALAAIVAFPLDILYGSRDFIAATVRLMVLLTAVKVAVARSSRDYLFLGLLAFLHLLSSSMFVTGPAFLAHLGVFVALGGACYLAFELRRGAMEADRVASGAGEKRLGVRLAGLGAALAAAVLALGALAFFLIPRPRLGTPVSMRGGHFVGFSNEVNLGATGSLAPDPTPVMRVESVDGESLEGLRWRGIALYAFDGVRWSAPRTGGRILQATGQGMRLGHQRRADEGRRLSYRVALEPLATDAMFFAGQPEQLQGRFQSVLLTESGSLHAADAPPGGLRYEATSWLADRARLRPTDVVELFSEQFRRMYFELPAIDPRIAALAEEIVAGEPRPLRRAERIEEYLRREYGYSLSLPAERAADPLAHFLFERREGHCEYFASAMAVMLRSLGIPSRLVNGFLGGVRNELTGAQVLRSADAHSWVEAYIPGYGWLEFDPTPAAPPPPAGLLTGLWMYWDAFESAWLEWVVDYDASSQARLAQALQRRSRLAAYDVSQSWNRLLESLERSWQALARPGAVRPASLLAGLGGALAAAAMAWRLAPRLAGWRRRRRLAAGRGAAADSRYYYERALRALARRGFVRGRSQTAEEFLRAVGDPAARGAMTAVVAAYNAARFGANPDAERRLPALVDSLERTPRSSG